MLLRCLVATGDRSLNERIKKLLEPSELLVSTLPSKRNVATAVAAAVYDLIIIAARDSTSADAALEAAQSAPERPEVLALTPPLRPSDSAGGSQPEIDDSELHAALLTAGCVTALSTELGDADLRGALLSVAARRLEHNLSLIEAQAQSSRQSSQSIPFTCHSPSMRNLMQSVRRVASVESPVLVLGETGVGKERIAQLIHSEGCRRSGPFIALNCAAIPSELLESELFGHEKGAFTGASKARRGLFELANQGTLFLDEIGELPARSQSKLLRVLQDSQIRPVGADEPISVDVRLIAATNRNLKVEMEADRFRQDLFYRLSVVELEIPPLRERPEDLKALIDRLVPRFNDRLNRDIEGIEDDAREALLSYSWPGNVRELINVLERATLLSLGTKISVDDLPGGITQPQNRLPIQTAQEPAQSVPQTPDVLALPESWLQQPWKQVREELLRQGERAYISNLLLECGGRIGLTAKRAGIAERSLFEKMKRIGLKKEDFRGGNK